MVLNGAGAEPCTRKPKKILPVLSAVMGVSMKTVELKPDKLYTPGEVAALLNVSYDTAVRRMQSMRGCVDMGTQTKRYKRGKKLLRISGKNLVAFLRAETKE